MPARDNDDPSVKIARDVPPATYTPASTGGLPHDPHYQSGPSDRAVQAFREIGVPDPEGLVSKPLSVQAHVLTQAVRDKYGLGSMEVQTLKKDNPREVVDQLIDAHQNMQWMAHVMGVPNEALGLGKKLGLTFGSKAAPILNQGGKRAMAVYAARPDGTGTITLGGRSNSFAHEWTHALDHQLSGQLTNKPGDFLSESGKAFSIPASTPVDAFGRVMGALYGKDAGNALDYLRASYQDQTNPTSATAAALTRARAGYEASDFYTRAHGMGGTYFKMPAEMLARSHEAYLAHKVDMAGGPVAGGLSKGTPYYLNEADKFARNLYPKGDDRTRIFQAWDQLHDTLRSGGVYQPGPAAPAAPKIAGVGPANPAHQLDNISRTQASYYTRAMQRVGADKLRGADPGYLKAHTRVLDGMRHLTFTPRGMMNTIHARVPAAAKAPLRKLIDTVATEPGTDRHIPETFEEQVHARTRADNISYARMVTAADQINGRAKKGERTLEDGLSDVEQAQLHAMMTQAEDISKYPIRVQRAIQANKLHTLSASDKKLVEMATMAAAPKSTPAQIRAMAAGARFILDKRYYDMRQAGLEIPYASGYFPRLYDDHKIYADPHGFEADAARAMVIRHHQEVYDDVDELRDRLGQVKDFLDPNDLQAIRASLRATTAAHKAIVDQHAAAGTTPPDFTAEDALPDAHHRDVIAAAWATQAAKHWVEQIRTGYATDYATRGPAAKPLRARVMPAEADAILRKWMVLDPHAVIPNYMRVTTRKIAFVQRFGQGGETIDQAIRDAVQGGMRPEDGKQMRKLVDQITGRGTPSDPNPVLDRVHAYGTMVLMPRAVFGALSEPMATLPRTGSVRATYLGFAQTIKDIMRTGSSQDIARVAEAIGAVADAHFDGIHSDRLGANYTDSVALGKMLTNYFRRVGLTQVTNAQRRGALVSAHYYLSTLAEDVLRAPGALKGRIAAANMRELGIADKDQQDFATWLTKYARTKPPSPEDVLGTKAGHTWATAVNRFIDQVNQDPKGSEKPMYGGSSPIGRAMFGLMNFNYAWFGNVVEGYFNRLHRNMHIAQGPWEKMRVAFPAAILAVGSVGAMFAASLAQTALREALFNGTTWDEHEAKGDLMDWLSELAFNRIGLNGPLDPIIQAINNLRYQKSFTSLLAGAQQGFFLKALQDTLGPLSGESSPDTNTARYNAAAGAYKLFAMPMLAKGLTAIPGGPLVSALAGAAIQKLTSQSAADAVATAAYGPRGSRTADSVQNVDPEARVNAEIERAINGTPDKDQGGGIASSAAGLADDFAIPAMKLFGRLPGPFKIGAAILGGLGGAAYLRNDAQQFTEAPAPNDARAR